jgi:hypothetical protein
MQQQDLFGLATEASKYPDVPGHKGRDTGIAAAEAIAPKMGRLQQQALRVIEQRPSTPDEVATALGVSILSIRPRISELSNKGLIADSGARRENRSGKKAIVWRRVKKTGQL